MPPIIGKLTSAQLFSFFMGVIIVAINPVLFAASSAGYTQYFIPGNEVAMRRIFDDVSIDPTPAGNGNTAIIGISAWTAETTIYYDHWEDGYEFDENNPDGTYDEKIILRSSSAATQATSLSHVSFQSTFDASSPSSGECRTTAAVPAGNVCDYNGEDRLFVAGGNLTVTRSGWVDAFPGTFLALAWEVYPVRPQLTTYIFPFGEDIYDPDPTDGFPEEQFLDFERVFSLVQATQDNTVITIDFNADGTNDNIFDSTGALIGSSLTLNKGESFTIDNTTGGAAFPEVRKGTIITGSETIQVQYIIADDATDYELRGFSAFPRGLWDDEYYAPVPGVAEPGRVTSSNQDVTDIFIHNPHNKVLTINYDYRVGGTIVNAQFTMDANETTSFRAEKGNYVPPNTAVHFKGDDVFWGISTIDSSGFDDGVTSEGRIHDWGYSLVPASLLVNEGYLGWAWGYDRTLPPANRSDSEADDSGIFITPLQDNTVIFVDINNNGTVDTTLNLSRLETAYISDDSNATLSGELSGTRIYATGAYAAAYGQNPATTTNFEPESLDLGYTMIPNIDFIDIVIRVDKSVDPIVLPANTLSSATFTLVVTSGSFSVDGVSVVDTLPAGWTYTAGTTSIVLPDKTTVTDNPTISGSVLTWASSLLGSMAINQSLSITYQATANASHNEGDISLSEVIARGTRSVGGATQTFEASDFVFNLFSDSAMDITKSSNASEPLNPGDTFTYTVTVANNGSTALNNIAIIDSLPDGLSYVANSAMSNASGTSVTFRDAFQSVTYANNGDNIGGVNWGSDWIETGDGGGSPSGGRIRIDSNALRLINRDTPRSIRRSADLSPYTSAILSFQYRQDTTLESGEISELQVCSNFTGGTCVSGWVTAHSFTTEPDNGFVAVNNIDLNTVLSGAANTANFALRINLPTQIGNNDRLFYDNIQIVAQGQGIAHAPPSLITASDNLDITAGSSLIVTFDVLVDNPLATGIDKFVNSTLVTSAEINVPISASVTNLVVNPTTSTATVGDKIWLDTDSDGNVDVGEPGLANITVTLKDQFGTPIDVTTTNSLGFYSFTGVTPGNDYYVAVDAGTLPSGLTQVASTGTNNRSPSFDLVASQMKVDVDLGYATPSGTATIGDRVWSDADGDGIQDLGEVGLTGIIVQLYDDSGTTSGVFDNSDSLITTTMTTAGGDYLFTSVASSGTETYHVIVDTVQTLLNGYVATTGNINTLVDPDDGDVLLNADFGFRNTTDTHTITDRIWFDFDGTASTENTEDDDTGGENNESGITGVTVDLLDASMRIIATTITTSNGLFSFTGVPGNSADYTISVTDTGSILNNYFGSTHAAQSKTLAINNLTADVDASSEPNDPNFGYNLSGTVGDTVFNDIDGNQSQGAGEPGINNVTVQLFDALTGGTLLATTTTDSNGFYLFTGLSDATYFVEIADGQSVLSGFTRTTPGNRQSVSITAGSNELAIDFGYDTANPSSIAGTIWDNDNDNSTIDSGEDGYADITVDLLSATTVVATITTDSNGNYSFSNLPGGTYTVRLTDTSGLLTGLDANFEIDSPPPFDGEAEVILPISTNTTDVNFGFKETIVTNPITLRSFSSSIGQLDNVMVRWTTATEVGNLGFNLYALANGRLTQLNAHPIASKVVHSVSVVEYSYLVTNFVGEAIVLMDTDIKGRETKHGPFEIDQSYGHNNVPKRIDWQTIQAEHQQKAKQRLRRSSRPELAKNIELRIAVNQRGIYRLSFAQILAATGIDMQAIDTDEIAMTVADKNYPLRIVSDTFEPSASYIEFFGQSNNSLYTDNNIYTLIVNKTYRRKIKVDANSAFGIDSADYYLQTTIVEPQSQYDFTAIGNDPWYASRMLAWKNPFHADFSIYIDDFMADVAPIEFSVDGWGVTNWPGEDDHHMIIRFNNTLIEEMTFDGLTAFDVVQEINDDNMLDGINKMHIELPLDTGNDFDLINLNSWKITYARAFVARNDQLAFTASAKAFEVHNLSSNNILVYRNTEQGPVYLENLLITEENGTFSVKFIGSKQQDDYFVSTVQALNEVASIVIATGDSGIRFGFADYLIISHPDFINNTLQRLVQFREAQGYQVKIVNVNEIYKQFNANIVDAHAIKDYIRFAANNLGTRYVLLVGGDTYDYHDYLGLQAISFIPSLYMNTGDIVGFAPVDALYTDINDDFIPDLAIGRLPVRNDNDLNNIVNKTIAYEQRSYVKTALFIADLFDNFQDYSFSVDSVELLNDALLSWQSSEILLDEMSVSEARNAMFNAINYGLPYNGDHNDIRSINRTGGVSLVNYMGHSGPSDWTFSGLFSSLDAENLNNIEAPTAIFQWGCWNSYYVAPTEQTLGHSLLLNKAGAAISLGASTLTDAEAEFLLAKEVYLQMFNANVTLGEAVLKAKQIYAADYPNQYDVIFGWTILGDPAIVIQH